MSYSACNHTRDKEIRTPAARSSEFVIILKITDRIRLHSVLLTLLIDGASPYFLPQAHWKGWTLGSSGIWSSGHTLHMCSIGKTQANQILWQNPAVHCRWMWHVHGTWISRANHVHKSAASGFDWWPQTITADHPGQLGNDTWLECIYVWKAFWAS